MAENPADARLDQHQLSRLTALAERQDEANRRLDGVAAETRELNHRLDVGLEVVRETNRRLETSGAKTDEILMTFGQIQSRMLDELEQLHTEQQRSKKAMPSARKFDERQEEFNRRQDEFNVIFLEEIRPLKSSDRTQQSEQNAKGELLLQPDARLRRLEDFMNGL